MKKMSKENTTTMTEMNINVFLPDGTLCVAHSAAELATIKAIWAANGSTKQPQPQSQKSVLDAETAAKLERSEKQFYATTAVVTEVLDGILNKKKEEPEPKPEPEPTRAVTSRGSLPKVRRPANHADDCPCNKCERARRVLRVVPGHREFAPISVKARHMSVLGLFVKTRRSQPRRALSARAIAGQLGTDVSDVRASLQYLRLHDLATRIQGSRSWIATSTAVNHELVPA